MRFIYQLCLLSLFLKCDICNGSNSTDQLDKRKFPSGFLFGVSSSAYQIEGGWNQDGKSENIWDHLLHSRSYMDPEGANGDIAADSYHLYKRDVEMVKDLEVDFYRFSLSWTRILPSGFTDKFNLKGIAYYNNLIDELLRNNIEPMVTVFHWDLPQKLQEMGGWTNPHVIDWFADYARTVYKLFGDRVKYWITINEPFQICSLGYGDVVMAPALNLKGIAEYMCNKYVLLAHAKAYHIYDKEFRATQQGSIFITLNVEWFDLDPQSTDFEAAEDMRQFWWGMYAHPIFSELGDFPQIIKDRIANKSSQQGFPRSRLLPLTAEEVEFIHGTSDFFGLNHYSTYYVYRNASVAGHYEVPSFFDDVEIIIYQDSQWALGNLTMKYVPWGLYKLLTYITKNYNNPPVFITENGFSTGTGLQDDERVTYLRGYLDAVLDAISEGSDIRGYSYWALMDDYEWLKGYSMRFGLYEVDFNSTERTRTARLSAFVYKHIVRTHMLDMHYEPNITLPNPRSSGPLNYPNFLISMLLLMLICCLEINNNTGNVKMFSKL